MSIPKIFRRYFLYDRKLLSEFSRCGWESLKTYFNLVSRDSKAVPGAAVAHAPPLTESPAYENAPPPSVEDYIADPVYPMDAYF